MKEQSTIRYTSIRVKLFLIIIIAFIGSAVSILLIADKKLTKIIDDSKNALYKERVDNIWSVLNRSNERLKKTGMVDAYIEDFKRSTLKELEHTYYSAPELSIYPFIIDSKGDVILHPTIQKNTAPPDLELVNLLLVSEDGEFEYVYRGVLKYYTFRRFSEWQWVIGYTVPLKLKYAEARKFRDLLIIIMVSVTLVIVPILFLVITRFSRPITRLTNAARAMADGDLNKEIDLGGNDEIGTLALSFRDMRESIKKTITQLKRENTERKNAEMALAREKEQLAVTLRSIGDGVITTDTRGNILLMNKVAGELTGWSNREAAGHSLGEVFRVADCETGKSDFDIVDGIVQNGIARDSNRLKILTSRDGRESIIANSGAAIRDASSTVIGTVLVFRDITSQVEIEKELLKSRKLESIGVLAGGIAHDFNNILAAILGNINLTLLDDTLTEKTKKLLSNAEKASIRAKGLTQQLLTFSKGGAPIKEVSSLQNIIKDSADFFLHGHKVACQFDIPDDLWPADVDKGQISQVIQNIVLNGSEAMSNGGVIKISCTNIVGGDGTDAFLSRGRKFVAISITDSGSGIPVSELDRIFDPYFSTKAKGSGLGLAVCHSIISKHNGHISVNSNPNVGTTFTIYLPASEKIQPLVNNNVMIKTGSQESTIMIMDDEEPIREMAVVMLRKMGHKAVMAVNGSEALSLYKKYMQSDTPIDIVIMDLTIPGAMGGQEAVKKLLALDPQAKAIVSSGYSHDPIMANCGKFGFQAAIVKPYRYNELAAIIDSTLKKNIS